jgi:hypothetical protein
MAPDRLFFQGPSVATERSTPGTALGGTVDLHFDVGLRVRAGFYDDSRQPWREGSLRPLAVLRAEWSKGSLDRLGGIASQTAYAFGTDVWLETAHGTHTSGEGLDAVLRNWRFAVYSEIRHLRERVGTDEPRDQIAATGQVSYTQPLPLGSLEVAARAAIFDEDLDLPGVHQGQVVEVGLVWHSPWELADVGVGYIRRDETKQDEIRDDTVRVWLQLQRRRIWKGHVEDTPHGRWPSNEVPVTFGPSPLAPAEMLKDFDAILIPGCPSRPRGAPSRCQRARVASALLLHRAGYADWFIVSGGAVQNEHNEAEALRKLLVMEGVPSRHILLEPRAEHTDENFYYTTQIMEERGWDRVLVATDGGHMLYVATCDANCCVRLGRLSSYDFPTDDGDLKAAAYELSPPSRLWTDEECRHIEQLERFMGTTLSQRKTCADLP